MRKRRGGRSSPRSRRSASSRASSVERGSPVRSATPQLGVDLSQHPRAGLEDRRGQPGRLERLPGPARTPLEGRLLQQDRGAAREVPDDLCQLAGLRERLVGLGGVAGALQRGAESGQCGGQQMLPSGSTEGPRRLAEGVGGLLDQPQRQVRLSGPVQQQVRVAAGVEGGEGGSRAPQDRQDIGEPAQQQVDARL